MRRRVYMITVSVLCAGLCFLLSPPVSRADTGIQKISRQFFLPHIAADGQVWNTYLIADNLGTTDASYTVTLYRNDGTVARTLTRSAPPQSFQAIDLATEGDPAAVTAQVFAANEFLTFRIGYLNSAGAVTEYTAPAEASATLAFNCGTYYPNIGWKSLAVMNTSTTGDTLTMTALDATGQTMAQIQREVGPHARLAFYLNSNEGFGTDFDWFACSRVLVEGSVGLSGVNMSGEGNTRILLTPAESAPSPGSSGTGSGSMVVIAWNDLGMHCYDDDFSIFSILPPYQTLWAQVIRMGSSPEIVTDNIRVTYQFENNTTSVGKTNFWDHADALFGVQLSPGTGLTGKLITGDMDAATDHFIAEGIPLTERNDDGSVNHYQIAIVRVWSADNTLLAETRTVAPVSTEMNCATCHHDGGVEGISTGNFRTNILRLHDQEEGTNLFNSQPVLCASCHPDPALGITTGPQKYFSLAMHETHDEVVAQTTSGCYNCHPGQNTQCLRGVMAANGLGCTNCHGTMQQVGSDTRIPWLNEPDCGQCHDYGAEAGKLYRQSRGHGGIYCEACHGSTHAEYPSTLAADNMQSIRLQGYAGSIGVCGVCHSDGRTAENPHVAGK